MITKMKKLTFLVYHKEYDAFLNNLRDLGVVHIAEKQQGMADNSALQEKIRLSARLSATIKLLQNIRKGTCRIRTMGRFLSREYRQAA